MMTMMTLRTVGKQCFLQDREEELGAEEAEGGEGDGQAGEEGPHLGGEGEVGWWME